MLEIYILWQMEFCQIARMRLSIFIMEILELQNLLASYRYYLEDDQPQSILLSVPRVLEVADVPQIIALAVAVPVHIDGLVGFGKARLGGDLYESEMVYPRAVAALTGQQEMLKLE